MAVTRRQFLGSTALGAAASLLPPSVHQAIAQPIRAGGMDTIEHVVILMQENRAFDHYFGQMRGVAGFSDAATVRRIFAQDGVLPFSLRTAARRAGRDSSDIQYLDALDHSWDGGQAAWADGWNTGWIDAKSPATMTYYERRDLPLQYELADTFTICDAYHCSVLSSTAPNRNYLWTGTTGYEPGSDRRAVENDSYDYEHAGYDWTTYPERLEAAGVSWQIYQEWDNFTDNQVEYFLPFKRIGRKVLASVDGDHPTLGAFYDDLLTRPRSEQRALLTQLAAGRRSLDRRERRLYDRALHRSAPGTLSQRFAADAAGGRLAQVVWLVPNSVESEHPSVSTPLGSANLVYRVLDTIASDRRLWSRTALLINFDENDGYFDHVPPPVDPAHGDADWFDGKPIGLGYRVPMTVVSPWTVGGYVCSEVFDHTSVVRLLERWTGVAEPNISAWRRTACGDLISAFDFTGRGRPPRVDKPSAVPEPIDRWVPDPPTHQALPDQERGRRPARPLPYRPAVSVIPSDDLKLILTNTGRRSAHFIVYGYAGEVDAPVHADVTGTTVTRLVPPNNTYDIAVHGPNRFLYTAHGTLDGAAIDVLAAAERRRGGLVLTLTNHGSVDATVELRSIRYATVHRIIPVPAGSAHDTRVPTDSGWYDVTVVVRQDPSYRRRLTGHLETGRPSISG